MNSMYLLFAFKSAAYKRCVSKSGVLIAALLAAVSAPFFVSAESRPSPIVVESRSSDSSAVQRTPSGVSYRPPVEDEPQLTGIENQYQMQLLQQEVMELRGLVEQLQHDIGKLKSISDDRYLELDSRLQQVLNAPAPATGSKPTESTGAVIASEAKTPVDTGDFDEKSLYNTIQQLIRNRQYEMAISQLESLIERFPQGEYTANAYYWLGQVQAAKSTPDFEKARQALAQVISYFPEHSKVPDAAYALGKVYHTLGDCERAKELLEQVRDQYPGKSAAKLAENYLRESVNCEP